MCVSLCFSVPVGCGGDLCVGDFVSVYLLVVVVICALVFVTVYLLVVVVLCALVILFQCICSLWGGFVR